MAAYAYMHNMGWGWGILMMLLLLGVFTAFVLASVRGGRNPSPREILDGRLGAGEIDLEEYERARRAMSRDGSDGAPAGPPAAT